MCRIVKDMPALAYHAHPAISKSGLDRINECPALYKYWREHEQPDTDALAQGRAYHLRLLEPHLFKDEAAVWTGSRRHGNAWEEFKAENADKTIITKKQRDEIEGMAKSILSLSSARKLLSGKGMIEPSLFWTDNETGVECRCRFDWLMDEACVGVDLKSSRSARKEDFSRHSYDYRYHVQAAFYADGFEAVFGEKLKAFVLMPTEKTEPYLAASYILTDEQIALGRMEYRQNLQTYAECMERNVWPGYADKIEELPLPVWGQRKFEELGGIANV